jgi:glucosamine 6-phosphate synthetase-like amidotransferase/phosphosugar isomerase protein
LQKLVQALANASEVRGNHASGIAYNRPDRLSIFKRPLPAHKMRFRIPEGTSAVMGHTRLTTQGSQKRNENNHPFRGYAGTGFALAHNGVLYNDELLRAKLNLPETPIETDSYIAVQLIESQQDLTFDSLRFMAEQVRGYFTFTVLDKADNLFFVKGESPLYLAHFPTLGLYIYTSTKEIFKEAMRQLRFRLPKFDVIDVKEGEIVKIAADGNITRDKYTVQDDFFDYRWNGYFGYGWGWSGSASDCRSAAAADDDEDYALLIDMCGYWGLH